MINLNRFTSTDIGTINILWSFGNFGYILGMISIVINMLACCYQLFIYAGLTSVYKRLIYWYYISTIGCLLAGTVYKSWLPTQVTELFSTIIAIILPSTKSPHQKVKMIFLGLNIAFTGLTCCLLPFLSRWKHSSEQKINISGKVRFKFLDAARVSLGSIHLPGENWIWVDLFIWGIFFSHQNIIIVTLPPYFLASDISTKKNIHQEKYFHQNKFLPREIFPPRAFTWPPIASQWCSPWVR